MSIFPVCMYVCMSVLHTFFFQRRSKMPDKTTGTGVSEDVEELSGCLELNPGPLAEKLEWCSWLLIFFFDFILSNPLVYFHLKNITAQMKRYASSVCVTIFSVFRTQWLWIRYSKYSVQQIKERLRINVATFCPCLLSKCKFRILYWEVFLGINNNIIKNYVHKAINTVSNKNNAKSTYFRGCGDFSWDALGLCSGLTLHQKEQVPSKRQVQTNSAFMMCLLSLPLLSANPVFIFICKRLF